MKNNLGMNFVACIYGFRINWACLSVAQKWLNQLKLSRIIGL